MKSFLTDSVFLGVVVSLLTYEFGLWFKKKVKIAIFNPLLISVIAVMVFLVVFHIDYADYQEIHKLFVDTGDCLSGSSSV